MLITILFTGCNSKPSEHAVSGLNAEVTYNEKSKDWYVTLTWEYNSADPAEYLITRYDDENDERIVDSGTLKRFQTNSYSTTIFYEGNYTYKVYTVGGGASKSASKRVTVKCELPTYTPPTGGGSSGGTTKWYSDDGSTIFVFYSNGNFALIPNVPDGDKMPIFSGTYKTTDYGYVITYDLGTGIYTDVDISVNGDKLDWQGEKYHR